MKPLPVADLDHVLNHTRPLWDELRGGRIFLTGGTGFFGCWLVESFCHINTCLALGAQAVVLTRDTAAFVKKMPHLAGRADLCLHEGDVRNFAFPPGDFTHVIHGAASSGTPIAPELMRETIVSGTRRVLDFAAQCGAKKFLFISSGAVYGPQPPDLARIPETFIGTPDSAYGEGKKSAEELCAQAALDIKIARCFAFVGPHLPLDAHFAIGNFIRDALADAPIHAAGDGSPQRSYLYAADLAIWLWTILFAGAPGRAFNVGGDEALSIADLAGRIDRLRPAARGLHIARAVENSEPSRYVPDLAHARRELGLIPLVSLDDAIMRTLRWNEQP